MSGQTNGETRSTLEADHVFPSAARSRAGFHADVVAKIEHAIAQNDVVVVGMATNPHVKRARRTLADANIPFEYLEFGGYLSKWKERLAIKMWSGWPTFPQVFVRGKLVGGADHTASALEDGSLKRALEGKRNGA